MNEINISDVSEDCSDHSYECECGCDQLDMEINKDKANDNERSG